MELVEMQVAELSGAALDWAVAKALGWKMIPVPVDADGENSGELIAPPDLGDGFRFPPRGKIEPCYFLRKWSTNWAQGGPLFDEFAIYIGYYDGWLVAVNGGDAHGSTKLEALCRAIVCARLGDTVSVPKELTPCR